jgi:hypothetical protein
MYLKGVIVDKRTNSALSRVQVFALDNDTKSVVYDTFSNAKGSFLLKKPARGFHIIVIKKNFEPMVIYPNNENFIHIALHIATHHSPMHNRISHTVSRLISMFFESFIVLSLIVEFFLTQVFGIEKTWAFIILSLLNVVLWFYYLSIKHHKDI